MRVERHIFGSFSGYTTLARSAQVAAEDIRSLESGAFAFGQTNERSVLEGLARQASYFTRLLPSGNRGLTRVIEGELDDNGRWTLLLVTAIVSQADWDSQLTGDVLKLLDADELWRWDRRPELQPVDMRVSAPDRSLPGKTVSKALALISELESHFTSRRSVLVTSDDFSAADLRAVEILMPPSARPRFTSAYRSFSPSLPVALNCVATESAGGRSSFRYQPNLPLSPYAEYLSASGLSGGTIPYDAIADYRSFGAVGRTSAPAAQTAAIPTAAVAKRRATGSSSGAPYWLLAVVVVLGMLAVGAAYFLGGEMGRRRGQRMAQVEAEASYTEGLSRQAEKYEQRLAAALGIPDSTFDQSLEIFSAKLKEAEQSAATPPPAPAPAPAPAPTTAPVPVIAEYAKAQEEADRLREFYVKMSTRQRDRFNELRREIIALRQGLTPQKILLFSDDIQRIHMGLEQLEEEWPYLPADQRAWTQDLKMQKAIFDELADTSRRMNKARLLIEKLARDINHFMKDPSVSLLDDIQRSLDISPDAVADVPEGIVSLNMELGEFRRSLKEQIGQSRERLIQYEKSRDDKDRPEGDKR